MGPKTIHAAYLEANLNRQGQDKFVHPHTVRAESEHWDASTSGCHFSYAIFSHSAKATGVLSSFGCALSCT